MCGIAGIALSSRGCELSAFDATLRMVKNMHPRGPDADGLWSNPGVVLGHSRLAILDLNPRANQPMSSPDGRYEIVFNGEIYNFLELRSELESAGVIFRTTCDTELLLVLYARQGDRMLSKLRGMFAFAIWDRDNQELFLARDPYGIKPLYYAQIKEGFLFASQVKALLASGLLTKELEPAGLASFYLWGSVQDPWSLYRGVLALPAGHWLRVRAGMPDAPVCWHDIRQYWREDSSRLSSQHGEFAVTKSRNSLKDRVQESITDSLRAHFVSDVPLCLFLSGGVDSAVLAGIAAEADLKIEAITIGFDEFSGRYEDEVPAASAIAEYFGVPHFVRRISRSEFESDIPRIFAAMDQPSIDGVNTWFASKVATERGYKVALSGVGGDELFCGYSTFQRIPRDVVWGNRIAAIPGLRSMLRLPLTFWARNGGNPKLSALPDLMGTFEGAYFLRRGLFLQEELSSLMGVEMAREGLARLGGVPPGMTQAFARDGISAVGLLESTYYLRNQLLRDGDWASMAHSLELRTPLVDIRLLEALGPSVPDFIGGAGKAFLANSLIRPLPESIINRPKTGFGLPMAQWLSESTTYSPRNNKSSPVAPDKHWSRNWAGIVADQFML